LEEAAAKNKNTAAQSIQEANNVKKVKQLKKDKSPDSLLMDSSIVAELKTLPSKSLWTRDISDANIG